MQLVPKAWRDPVEVVAMDGFTGIKTAAAEELPDATAVMDPSTWSGWPGTRSMSVDAGSNSSYAAGHKHDPLHKASRTLHTGADLLTDKQAARSRKLFANEAHVAVEATWGIYQRLVEAYRHPDQATDRD